MGKESAALPKRPGKVHRITLLAQPKCRLRHPTFGCRPLNGGGVGSQCCVVQNCPPGVYIELVCQNQTIELWDLPSHRSSSGMTATGPPSEPPPPPPPPPLLSVHLAIRRLVADCGGKTSD